MKHRNELMGESDYSSPAVTRRSPEDLPVCFPGPFQHLTGVEIVVKPVSESIFDHILVRDAVIFARLAKV